MKYKISIKTKKKIFGLLQGRNLSKFRGNGLDFKEFREYIYGEDAKKIDWKISAKIQKPLIKEYDEERELKILIAVIKSGSLNFGSYKLKSDLISEIIAILGLAGVYEENKVQVVFLGKKKKFFKPTKSPKTISAIVEYSKNINYLKESFNEIEMLNSFPKSILFVISDFFTPLNIEKLKHETYAIIVRDKFEEDPKFQGSVNIIDPNNFKENSIYFTKKEIQKIKNFIKTTDQTLIEKLKKHKIPFIKIYTDEDPIYKIIKLLR